MEGSPIPVLTVPTVPYEDQRPAGGGGLRRPTGLFEGQRNYLPNFIQSVLSSIDLRDRQGCTMVVGSDGRYFSRTATEIVVQMAAANGVSDLPRATLASRRAAAVRGPRPAPSSLPPPRAPLATGSPRSSPPGSPKGLQEMVFLVLTRTEHSWGFLQRFHIATYLFLVMGPYVRKVLCDELGAPANSAINCVPLEDFGGQHPDPNLTYATTLLEAMKGGEYGFGAAFDADGDRYMILGRNGFFVSPSDSLAIIAANLSCIPYFRQMGVRGFGRSMPTSTALDRVAKSMKVPVYETPAGWRFFSNLMDSGRCSLCGEESFGTGRFCWGDITGEGGCGCSPVWSQGLRIIFSDASRLIFRLSSSSSVRATIRLYAESYERDPSGHDQEPQLNMSEPKQRLGIGDEGRHRKEGSTPSVEPIVGLELTTLRSRPELRSRVGSSTYGTTQVPQHLFFLNKE
nr:phosphoglucomutase-like protein 5 [Mirounga angustirostris]